MDWQKKSGVHTLFTPNSVYRVTKTQDRQYMPQSSSVTDGVFFDMLSSPCETLAAAKRVVERIVARGW